MLKAVRCVFSFALILGVAASIFADTIRLKDGSMIKGHIASFAGGVFVVEVGQGSHRRQLKFAASEIESIVFDTAEATVEVKKASTPAAYKKPEPVSPAAARPITVINKPTVSALPNTPPKPGAVTASPIKWNTKVRADGSTNGWTNSGWVVKKGQRVRITADGNIGLGRGKNSPPSGLAELNDEQKLLKGVPTGALIAVVGDDNNDFLDIGAEREFTATRDGALFLGVNEGDLADNSGFFDVTIEIIPDTGS
jgi:hypothetical protein